MSNTLWLLAVIDENGELIFTRLLKNRESAVLGAFDDYKESWRNASNFNIKDESDELVEELHNKEMDNWYSKEFGITYYINELKAPEGVEIK